jgi:hypothetical protein
VLLGQRARRRLHHTGLGAGGREGVLRVEPLPPLAPQLFQPRACARKISHMSPLPLLSCAVIRALYLCLVHGLHVEFYHIRAAPLCVLKVPQ